MSIWNICCISYLGRDSITVWVVCYVYFAVKWFEINLWLLNIVIFFICVRFPIKFKACYSRWIKITIKIKIKFKSKIKIKAWWFKSKIKFKSNRCNWYVCYKNKKGKRGNIKATFTLPWISNLWDFCFLVQGRDFCVMWSHMRLLFFFFDFPLM